MTDSLLLRDKEVREVEEDGEDMKEVVVAEVMMEVVEEVEEEGGDLVAMEVGLKVAVEARGEEALAEEEEGGVTREEEEEEAKVQGGSKGKQCSLY